MSVRRDPLLEAASRVAQHGSVDWSREIEDVPEDQRRTLGNLRKLEALVSAFQQLVQEGPDQGSALPDDAARSDPLFLWGHLEVRERLGAGSFGEVYRAFDGTLERDVALKLRRREALGGGEDARAFIDEARRLARVRHPNVLAVHGADVHDGRVGLWSDLLVGSTLEATLQERRRLEVARALHVASAIASALAAVHDAGLVHGDVKGSNVMLERGDRVVLMDFGAGAEASAAHTSTAGSPLYMAPERLAGETGSASDLYSLGVLLHRMLCGRLPIEADTFDELVRRHEEHDHRSSAAAIDASRPVRALVAALLDPRPAQRPSAADTVERIRWIQQAPTRRRRRAAVLAVVSSLALGALAAGVAYWNARRSAQRAVAAREEAAAVNDFLRDLLASPQPTQGGREVRVIEVLAQAADALDRRFSGSPRALAATRLLIGHSYETLAEPATAEPLLRRAAAEHEELLGPDADETIVALAILGRALAKLQRVAEAREILERARQRAEARPASREALVEVYRALHFSALHAEELAEAERWIERALGLFAHEESIDDPSRRVAQLDLAALLNLRGAWRHAEEQAREVLEWSQRYNGERHANTLAARHNLALSLDRQGRWVEAEPLFRRNHETARGWLGEADPFTLNALGGIASNLTLQGRGDEAQSHLEVLVDLAHQRYGPDHETSMVASTNLATQLRENGDVSGAETMTRDLVDRISSTLGPRHQLAHINRYNLAEMLFVEARYREAASIARSARAEMAASLGDDHLFTLVTDAVLGASLAHLDDPEGVRLLREVIERESRVLGADHPNTLEARFHLAGVLYREGGRDEAIAILSEVHARRIELLGPKHPQTGEAARLLEAWRSEPPPA